ncbi:MAG: squalene synthase HpnC [Verrucomicrobiota bacterium]
METQTLANHYARCTALASSHYENFPVGRLVPEEIRPHVHAVYAFARTADDIADEGYTDEDALTESARLAQMHRFQELLESCLANQSIPESHQWIFHPLADTIKRFDLPPRLFRDLLSAFEQDIIKRRYQDFTEVTDYCRRSANPIGRLVLYLHGYREEKLHLLSDQICTGLQLANFWQDVSVDLKKDRIYLPLDEMGNYQVTIENLKTCEATQSYQDLLQFQVERTWTFFRNGESLTHHLKDLLRWEIRMTWLGGTTILKKIKSQSYDTLSHRPQLSKFDMLCLLPYAWLTK